MKEFLEEFFSSDFMPHGYCYLWNSGLVWLHVVSDALIALAYFSIPVTLIYFIRKRRDLPFHWIFVSFGMFILACGATHTMEVWTLWHGNYWLSGAIKAVTAMASVPTAILLVRLIPQALALPSPVVMRLEIAERKRTEQALHEAKNELELRVLERTAELSNANEDLVAEITQRKRAEAALRQTGEQLAAQGAQLRELFEQAPEGIVLLDVEERVLRINPEFSRIFGYAPDEAIGRPINDLIAPEELRSEAEEYTHQLTHGKRVNAETIRCRKDGRRVHVSLLAVPISVPGGQIAEYAIYRDITEHKIVAGELTKQRAHLDELFERVPEAIALVDLQTVIIRVNPEFSRIFGYSCAEAIGCPLKELVAPGELRGEAEEFTKQVTERGETLNVETIRGRKDGSRFPVSILAVPVSIAGSQVGEYVIYRDITERKQAEEALLAERTRIAGELHDTLLQSFHGLLFRFQAARNMLLSSPDRAMQALDTAILRTEEAIAEGREAIKHLRAQSVVRGDLADLLVTTGQDLAASQTAKDDLPDFRVIVEGERRTLSPILLGEVYCIARELLRNAFQHASARHIEAEIRYDNHLFRLRVRDDGKGIDRKVLEEGGRAGHWGLPGAIERAQRIGARLEFWSEAGAGTEVQLSVSPTVAYKTSHEGLRSGVSYGIKSNGL